MTDEQLVLVYLDPAQERLDRAADRRFDDLVEATRLGTLFAHDAKVYRRWTDRKRRRAPSRSLSGEALERAVMGVARLFPANVVQGAA